MTNREALNAIADMCNALQLPPNSRQGEAMMMAINSLKNGTPPAKNRGEWIDGDPICHCCGEDKFKGLEADIYADWKPNFCPNCGADMRGET